jgi:hypothetical protein
VHGCCLVGFLVERGCWVGFASMRVRG